MVIIDPDKAYRIPQARVVEVNVHGVLCQSPDNGAVTIDGYTEEKLNW